MNDKLREYARVVERMRARQRAFFRDKLASDFRESKMLEKKVDVITTEVLAGPSLFAGLEETPEHRFRNVLSNFASVTEAIRTLSRAGKLDLSAFPLVLEMVEDCHETIERMERESKGRASRT